MRKLTWWAICGVLCLASLGCKSTSLSWPFASKKSAIPPYSVASSTPPQTSLPSATATPTTPPGTVAPYAATASAPYGASPAASPYAAPPASPYGAAPTATYPNQPTSYTAHANDPWANGAGGSAAAPTMGNPALAPQSGYYNNTYPGSSAPVANGYPTGGYGAPQTSLPAAPTSTTPTAGSYPTTGGDNRYGTAATSADPTAVNNYPQYAPTVRTAQAPRYSTGTPYDSATGAAGTTGYPTTQTPQSNSAPSSGGPYQPGNTGYTPGNTGYTPAGAQPYSAPVAPYQPGSTRGKELVPTAQVTPGSTNSVQTVSYESQGTATPSATSATPATSTPAAASPSTTSPATTPNNNPPSVRLLGGATNQLSDSRYADYYSARDPSGGATAPAQTVPAVAAPTPSVSAPTYR